MTAQMFLIGCLSASAAWCLVRTVVHQPRTLASRVEPYAGPARQHLGTFRPERAVTRRDDLSGVRLVFGPIITRLAEALGRVADTSASTSTELRLRQAGLAYTVEQYRVRQLGYTTGAIAVGALIGVTIGHRAGTMIMVALIAGLWGATRSRAKLDHLIRNRRVRMRAELYTVCQLLAIYLRTGDTPSGAIDRITRRGAGDVIGELAEAAAQVRSGGLPNRVFEQIVAATPEPSAGRLYRLLSSTWTAGGDPDALLALAEDLRAARREDIQRLMAKRQTIMALPLVMVIGPILILFVAAAIPHIVLGR